ncbi:hypothetical protein ABNF65_18475 [Paenibacillus larvae]
MNVDVYTTNEKFVGRIWVHTIPREGETICFFEERLGHKSWCVENVRYWLGDGEVTTPYQIVLYVMPDIELEFELGETEAEHGTLNQGNAKNNG